MCKKINKIYNHETKKKFFQRNINDHWVNESYFINSGGWRGLWYRQSGKKLFDSMYKYHFDIENSWRVTLEYMLMVHKLLEGKPHIHFFSYDTFEAQDFGQYEKKDRKERVYNKQKWQSKRPILTKYVDVMKKLGCFRSNVSNTKI